MLGTDDMMESSVFVGRCIICFLPIICQQLNATGWVFPLFQGFVG